MSSRRKEAFFLYFVQITNLVIPFLVFPYLTRVLGLSGFGKLGYVQAVITLGIVVVDFGYDYIGSKLISSCSSSCKGRSIIYANIQFAKLFLAAIVMLFFFIFYFFGGITGLEREAFLYSIPSVLGSILVPTWLFQGIQKLSVVAIVTVIIKVALMAITLICVEGEQDLCLATSIQLYSNFCIGIIVTFLAFKNKVVKIKFMEVSIRRVYDFFSDALHVFIGSAITLGFTYGNPIVIKILAGDESVGKYVAAERVVSILRQAFMPLVQANFSHICSLSSKGYIKEVANIARKNLLLMMGLSGIAFILTLCLADIIFPLLLGGEYKIKIILLLLIVAHFFIAISLVQVTFFVIPRRLQYILKWVYGAALFFHCIYVVPLVLYFNGEGIAISMIITEGIVVIGISFCLKKDVQWQRFLFSFFSGRDAEVSNE